MVQTVGGREEQLKDLNNSLVRRCKNHELEVSSKASELAAKASELAAFSTQLDVSQRQISDLYSQNGEYLQKLKATERRLAEMTLLKVDAVKIAECFHEQNKVMIAERRGFEERIQNLKKQATAVSWNEKMAAKYGRRMVSPLKMDASPATGVPTPTDFCGISGSPLD